MDFKSLHFDRDVVLLCMRWYLAYPLSYRNIEEMMLERGVSVDHSTLNRWVLRFTPALEKRFRKWKKPTGGSWRMDETYILIKGKWSYLYRAVDKDGETIDFLLRAHRDLTAARKFFEKAFRSSGRPEKINIDKSGSNLAGIDFLDPFGHIKVRQVKYLNNIVEQDHRRIKRRVRPMMGFKSFRSAKITLGGIETLAMLKKAQSGYMPLFSHNPVDAFYQLTA